MNVQHAVDQSEGVGERNVVVEEEQEEQEDRKISEVKWSEVKCQNEVTKQLAGMQGKPGGVGIGAGGWVEAEFGLALAGRR